MPSEDRELPGADGQTGFLDVLLETALRGDAEAADTLSSILATEHGARIINYMRKRRSQAHTHTLEDVFQQGVLDLIEMLKAGKLRELGGKKRLDIIAYLQRICDNKLDWVFEERSAPYRRDKPPLHGNLIDKNAEVPGAPRDTERHLHLIDGALKSLSPEKQWLLTKYREGVPYSDLAKESGKSPNALMLLVNQAKEELLQAIAPQSPTALLHQKAKSAPPKKLTPEAIQNAAKKLPPELREAIQFIHFDRGTMDAYAIKLGDRGFEKAQARLKQAYRSLSGKLKAPFPQTFEEIG